MKRMKSLAYPLFASALLLCGCNTGNRAVADAEPTLKEALSGKFMIGTSVNVNQQEWKDSLESQTIASQFNTVVAENCMKCEVIHPERDRYDFTLADEFVKFGEQNNQYLVGHCLIWHSQLAPWFCVDEKGNNVSADTLKLRMKNHIQTIVGRYKGRIKGWDVVNEAIEDDGSYRKSKFYEILGEEFIPLAFQYAHEADPDAELFYNDYSMAKPGKMKTVITMVKAMKEKGLRVDAVGFQGHMTMNYPTIEEFGHAIDTVAQATGCKIMVTELDITAIPSPFEQMGAEISQKAEYEEKMNPYKDGLTAEADSLWTARMNGMFKLFLNHSDQISRVNMWGLTDGNSWRNYWPIMGRTDYPLLFDRKVQPKKVVGMIIEEAMKEK